MGFGMTFDGQMAARMKAYLQRVASAGHERDGGRPTDGTETITDVASAVKRLARADKGRTLMSAIDRLHAKRVSNGKPLVYVPE